MNVIEQRDCAGCVGSGHNAVLLTCLLHSQRSYPGIEDAPLCAIDIGLSDRKLIIRARPNNGGRDHFTLLRHGGSTLPSLRRRYGGSQRDGGDQNKAGTHGDAAANSNQCFTSIFSRRAPSIRTEPTAALYSRWRIYRAEEKPPASSSAAVPGR